MQMLPKDILILVDIFLLFGLKITCFILGYLTIKMGRDLLIQGVKGEFKFRGLFAGGKADLVSASPGLLFLLLGIGLIGYALWVSKVVSDEHYKGAGSSAQSVEGERTDFPLPGGALDGTSSVKKEDRQ